MSQISPPIRILLVVAVAFIGVYMLFVRPKDEVVPPVEPAPNTQTSEPAVSEPGKVAEAAQGAVEAANGQLQEQESVDGVDAGEATAETAAATKTAPKTGEAAAAEAGVDLNGIPKSIAKAIRKDKTLVLLFWNGKSADDKAVHKALANVDRWDGRVYVGSASIKKISKYGRITRGVDVEQSPTIVVADPELRAETLVGYVDTRTIDQAVVDAFRNTGGIFTDAYLKKVDAVCVRGGNKLAAIPNYYAHGSVKKFDARAATYTAGVAGFIADFKAVKAPKKWRAFRAAQLADLTAIHAALSRLSTSLTPNSTRAAAVTAIGVYVKDIKRVGKGIDRRFDREGLFRCGSQL